MARPRSTARANQVSVIFGGGSGSAAVTVNGLDTLSAFGGSAHVTLEYVRSAGRTTPVSEPQTISVGDYPISNGTITVPVNAMNAADGYHLVITPTGSIPSTLDGTYQLKNLNSGLLLGEPPHLFPVHPTFDGYRAVLQQQLPYLGTSLIVGLGTVALTEVLSAPVWTTSRVHVGGLASSCHALC
jgi:hypothetical protein